MKINFDSLQGSEEFKEFAPGRGDIHVSQTLTNISVAYVQSESGFVADQVFPVIPVDKQFDQYFTYDKGQWFNDEMEEQAPGAESPESGYTISTDTYSARVWSLGRVIPDQIRANVDAPIQLDSEAVAFLTMKGMLRRELLWTQTYFKTGVWSWEVDGAASRSASFTPTTANTANNDVVYWSSSGSTPIEDIRLAKRVVQEQTGFRPNTLTLGRKVFDTLIDHEDLIGRLDRGQTTGPAMVNMDALAALLEVDRVLVMDAIYNSAKKGKTPSMGFIGGNHAMLTWTPPSPGLMTPSAGYTFSWRGLFGSNSISGRINRYRLDTRKSDKIEIEMAYDHKKVAEDLAFFFKDIVQ